MKDKKWVDINIKHKGYDFPKKDIPDKLDSVKTSPKSEEGAGLFDYVKHFSTKIFGVVKDVYDTTKNLLTLVPDIKTIGFTLLAILAIVLIIMIIQ